MKLSLYAALNLKVDKVCAVWGYYAAHSGNFLPAFRDKLFGPIFKGKEIQQESLDFFIRQE